MKHWIDMQIAVARSEGGHRSDKRLKRVARVLGWYEFAKVGAVAAVLVIAAVVVTKL